MKYLLCQPAIQRFKWELEVCLTNLKKVGIEDIVLLFSKHDTSIPVYFKEEYGVTVHTYEDNRRDKSYIPSIKPYLWWQYLKEDPSREKETYFYMDSDVIFRELIDFNKFNLKEDVWYCSDCNGYLNIDYIRSCKNGDKILQEMSGIVGVNLESLETINSNSGGAQWVITNPKKEYWEKVYCDSIRLFKYLNYQDSNIQIWTAEMRAQLWNMLVFNIGPKIDEELNFCWPTDPVNKWYETKILHNAGVTEKDKDLFFKGKYVNTSPFEDRLDNMAKDKATIKYIEAIKMAKTGGNNICHLQLN
ncbi:hypothetical protein [Enterococcus faecalis]|uniref:hypothetical protein n=1 Tax=Enterococcus faecalis TaxID=1351 RepID=UPI000669843C|nr:hypothetical protein [Enterococcus faecalis]MDV2551127.1 hypothetical protein [Enterococcus faecalis]HCT3556436.1 hypothetical protein [Enterococcus faecalis]